jgi:hypothetical protein
VEFYSKNKFENLVHLIGFIIRIGAVCIYVFGTRIPAVMYSSPEFKWESIRAATIGCRQYPMFSILSIILHDGYTLRLE